MMQFMKDGWDDGKTVPLVELPEHPCVDDDDATSRAIVASLRRTGFLLLRAPASVATVGLGRRALASAGRALERRRRPRMGKTSHATVVAHPVDPKVYCMLGWDDLETDGDGGCDNEKEEEEEEEKEDTGALREWYTACRVVKDRLLYHIARGLSADGGNGSSRRDPRFSTLANMHRTNNDALRLIQYLPGDPKTTGNRCKEHSDYGTLTLLLTDGVPGLEIRDDGGRWVPVVVPHDVDDSDDAGAVLVVNVGSILSRWTDGELKATLHRVAGPASVGSTTPRFLLEEAVRVPRTSAAYFLDPDEDADVAAAAVATTTAAAADRKGGRKEDASHGDDDGDESERSIGATVAEYIRWRSGGEGEMRSGVAYTPEEEARLRHLST